MSQSLFLICRVGTSRIALPATAVEAVAMAGDVVPVPHASAAIAGLVAVRSRLLTLIDIAEIAGEASQVGPQGRLMVISTVDGHGYGLQIDAVEDVAELGFMQAAPGNLSPAWLRLTSQMADHHGQLILIVEPANIIVAAGQSMQSAA